MENNEGTPERKKCRVKKIGGITAFAECHEPDSQSCPHALNFGYAMLCHHPEWQQMMRVDEGE